MRTTKLTHGCVSAVGLACWLTACTPEPDDTARTDDAPAAGAASQRPADAAAADAPPPGPLGDRVGPNHYALELRIDPGAATFSGAAIIDIDVARPTDRIWLHGRGLDVTEVYALAPTGERIGATYSERLPSGVVSLDLERELEPGPVSLHFVYTAPFNDSNNALFVAERDGERYVASQLQPIAARQIFPSFDEPRFKTPWDVSITTRPEHIAVTNSPEISTSETDDGWVRHEFATSAPLPTYLLAFFVGPYDVVAADAIPENAVRSRRSVPLRGIAARGMGSRFALAFEDTPAVLAALEQYFQSPYPYAKLDLIAMPESGGFGGMENAGAITYAEYLILAGPDAPLEQRRGYLDVHAHELAHMWFGDLVTPAWWTDIWLNESFASWMANKIAHQHWPEGEFGRVTLADSLGAMAADSLATARRIREPVERSEQISDAFDGITYQKGAAVLAMFENYLGEQVFRSGVRRHLDRFAHSIATADDFVASLAEGSGQPAIAPAFRSFLEQPGVPIVGATLECPGNGAPRVKLTQQRYAPLGSRIDAADGQWRIPLCVGYEADGVAGRTCTLLTAREAALELDAESCPASVHPNQGGAGYYRFTLDEPGWDALVREAAALPPAEALTLVDSLDAAFRADAVSAAVYVRGLAALAAHPAWDVVAATARRFGDVLDEALAAADRVAAERTLRTIYQPRYDETAAGDGAPALLLRRALADLLAFEAHDPELRAELSAQAAAYVGVDGDADPDAVPPDLLETAFGVGVQEQGLAFFDRLTELATGSNDPTVRDTALRALGYVDDPALVDRLREAILARRFPPAEATRMILTQVSREPTREPTWAWIQQHAEAVIEILPGIFRSRFFPRYGNELCSTRRAAELETLVAAHADALPGHERSLRQVVERNELCEALRERRGQELAAAFAAIAR